MSYFTHTKRFVPGDIARAEDVNEVFDDVATGFQNVDNDKVNKAGDTMTGNLTVPEPTAASHAATKNYVDTADAIKVDKAGDTMTGNLTVPEPTASGHAATKNYVDTNKVDKAGDTMTGNLTVNGEVHAYTFRARGGAPGTGGASQNGYAFDTPGDNDSGLFSLADGQVSLFADNTEYLRLGAGIGAGRRVIRTPLQFTNDPSDPDYGGYLRLMFQGADGFDPAATDSWIIRAWNLASQTLDFTAWHWDGTQDVYITYLRFLGGDQTEEPKVVLPKGRLQFPAAQLASADPNTLDDYEEGTWTPTLTRTTTAPSYTASYANGVYTKIGRLVQVSFRINIDTVSSQGSGYWRITGLPFMHDPVYPMGTTAALNFTGNALDQANNVSIIYESYIDIRDKTNQGPDSSSVLANSSGILGTAIYPTST